MAVNYVQITCGAHRFPNVMKPWDKFRLCNLALGSFLWKSVLVCSCCYNKIPLTGRLINNLDVFLTALEAGRLRSGCQCGHVTSSGSQIFLLCPHRVGRVRELWGFFHKSTNPPS